MNQTVDKSNLVNMTKQCEKAFALYLDHVEVIELIETSSAFTAKTSEGIIINVDKPVVKSTADMHEIINAFKTLVSNKKLPLLNDPRQLKGLEKNTRKLLKPVLNELFECVAIVNPTPISNVILSFLVKVDGIKIDHKVFKNPIEGLNWIRSKHPQQNNVSV
jgi:hypothetical protein